MKEIGSVATAISIRPFYVTRNCILQILGYDRFDRQSNCQKNERNWLMLQSTLDHSL